MIVTALVLIGDEGRELRLVPQEDGTFRLDAQGIREGVQSYLDREHATAIRDFLDQWLRATAS